MSVGSKSYDFYAYVTCPANVVARVPINRFAVYENRIPLINNRGWESNQEADGDSWGVYFFLLASFDG